jgi:hypothetical protein
MIVLYVALAIYWTIVALLCLFLSWEYGFKTVFSGALFWPIVVGRALIDNIILRKRS